MLGSYTRVFTVFYFGAISIECFDTGYKAPSFKKQE